MKHIIFLALSLPITLLSMETANADSLVCKSGEGADLIISRTIKGAKTYITSTNLKTGDVQHHVRQSTNLLLQVGTSTPVYDLKDKPSGTIQRISQDTFLRTFKDGTSETRTCGKPQ